MMNPQAGEDDDEIKLSETPSGRATGGGLKGGEGWSNNQKYYEIAFLAGWFTK